MLWLIDREAWCFVKAPCKSHEVDNDKAPSCVLCHRIIETLDGMLYASGALEFSVQEIEDMIEYCYSIAAYEGLHELFFNRKETEDEWRAWPFCKEEKDA